MSPSFVFLACFISCFVAAALLELKNVLLLGLDVAVCCCFVFLLLLIVIVWCMNVELNSLPASVFC